MQSVPFSALPRNQKNRPAVQPIKIMNDHVTLHAKSAFGDDFASFLDPLPFPVDNYSLSLSDPLYDFSGSLRAQDQLLESPLGLDLDQSPFDYAYEYSSPLLDGTPDSLSGLGTPELARGGELPSLFDDQFTPALPTWNSLDFASLPALPVKETQRQGSMDLANLISPPMTRLASVEVEQIIKEEVVEEVVEKKKVPRNSAKDKFSGTRNTKIAAIPIDAPTMSRSYIIPSATSRKRAAPATASATTKKAKAPRSRRSSTPFESFDNPVEPYDPCELPDELLTAIEIKRRSNTIAARISRNRKAEHLKGLQAEIDRLSAERDEWMQKALDLEAVVKGLRG